MAQTPKPIRKLSSRGGHYVSLLLNQHCSRVTDSAVYADGWDDAKVAAEASRQAGEEITPRNVAYVRLEVFGSLRRSEPVDPVAALEKRVAALEEKVSEALDLIGRRFDTLEGAVAGPSDLFTGKGGAHVNGRT